MNRKVEGTRTLQGGANSTWETPPEIYVKLNEDFGPFDIDLTADAQRHHHPLWFGPQSPVGEFDALSAKWWTYGKRGFSNPPYGDFIPKMLVTVVAAQHFGFSSTLLLPMRVTKAFKTYILPHASELLFADARIIFHENGQPRWNQKTLRKTGRYVGDPAMFDSIIVRYVAGHSGPLKVGLWRVPEHGKWKPEYEFRTAAD